MPGSCNASSITDPVTSFPYVMLQQINSIPSRFHNQYMYTVFPLPGANPLLRCGEGSSSARIRPGGVGRAHAALWRGWTACHGSL
jgi:hypothetical protein